jgi:hypothetical protein
LSIVAPNRFHETQFDYLPAKTIILLHDFAFTAYTQFGAHSRYLVLWQAFFQPILDLFIAMIYVIYAYVNSFDIYIQYFIIGSALSECENICE